MADRNRNRNSNRCRSSALTPSSIVFLALDIIAVAAKLAIVLALSSMLLLLQPVSAQSEPICDVCGYPNATITNPDISIDVTFLGLTDLTTTTCKELYDAGAQGLLFAELCTLVEENIDAVEPCGCTPSSEITATTPPTFPNCYMCGGDPSASVGNRTQNVDISFLQLDGITIVECGQIFDAAISGQLPEDLCQLLEEHVETQATCQCSNIGNGTASDSPTFVDTIDDTSAPTSPANDEDNRTIADIISTRPNLSTLDSAIKAANLSEALADPDGEFTIFAPTNNAFDALDNQDYLQTLITDPAYIVHLQNILLYHTLLVLLPARDILANNTVPTVMVNGEEVLFSRSPDDETVVTASFPSIAGDGTLTVVEVIQRNIRATNGLVHLLNGVLLPSFLSLTMNTLLATSVENFTIFPELFILAFPLGLPAGETYTVLAPIDEAFLELGESTLDELRDPANAQQLLAILANHIVSEIVPSVQLTTDTVLQSLGGLQIAVTSISSDGTIVFNNEASIVASNILASDGIIQAIDAVLSPEAPPAPAPTASDIPSVLSSDIPSYFGSVAPSTLTTALPTFEPSATLLPTGTASPVPTGSPVPTTTEAPTTSSAPVVNIKPTTETRAPSVRAPVAASQRYPTQVEASQEDKSNNKPAGMKPSRPSNDGNNNRNGNTDDSNKNNRNRNNNNENNTSRQNLRQVLEEYQALPRGQPRFRTV